MTGERDERVEYTAPHSTPKQQLDSSNYTTATRCVCVCVCVCVCNMFWCFNIQQVSYLILNICYCIVQCIVLWIPLILFVVYDFIVVLLLLLCFKSKLKYSCSRALVLVILIYLFFTHWCQILDIVWCCLYIFLWKKVILVFRKDALNRGANLSPFGEIRRFHLEIGHSRESCRSVKKKNWGGGGGVVVVSASHLCHVTCNRQRKNSEWTAEEQRMPCCTLENKAP